MEILSYITVGMGFVAGGCSTYLAIYFWRSQQSVARSVALMYGAEAVAMGVTIIFSIGAGIVRVITPEVELALR